MILKYYLIDDVEDEISGPYYEKIESEDEIERIADNYDWHYIEEYEILADNDPEYYHSLRIQSEDLIRQSERAIEELNKNITRHQSIIDDNRRKLDDYKVLSI
jgi:chromosome segregation ATPase